MPSTQVSQQTKLQRETYPDSDSKKYVQHISIRYRKNEYIMYEYVSIFYVVFVGQIRQRGDLSAFRCTESRTILILGATVQQEPRKVPIKCRSREEIFEGYDFTKNCVLYEFVRRSWDLFHFSHFSLECVG